MSDEEVSVQMMRNILRILTTRALEIQTKDVYAIGMAHYYERSSGETLPIKPMVEAMIAEQEAALDVVEEIHAAVLELPDDGPQGEAVEINFRCLTAKDEISSALGDLREANHASAL